MNNKYSQQDWQLISAYLDGQLSPKDKTHLEMRLQKDTLLQQAFSDLHQTKLLLKQAKTLKAPRNFTITEAQAVALKPVRTFRFLPILSLSSVLATVVLIFAIFFEFSLNPKLATNVAMQPAAETLSMESAPQMDAAREEGGQTNPLIIQWGGRPGTGGGAPDISMAMGGGSGEDFTAKSGSELPGMGGADPGAIETAPLPEAQPPAVLSSAPNIESEPITGTGPILGIRTEEEAATYNQAVLEILEEQSAQKRAGNGASLPLIRWIQTGFALIALITGGIALFMWRKSKI